MKNRKGQWHIFLFMLIATSLHQISCTENAKKSGQFASDKTFLEAHTPIVLLKNGKSAVAVAPAYQGRVMTSTFDDKGGPSFGWINRPVIEKGFLSDSAKVGKLEEHIYIFGGEERFWVGPEGGQYGFFFKPKAKFVFSDWKTPAAIDTEPFKLVEQTAEKAVFHQDCELVNYSGATFKMGIDRTIRLLDKKTIQDMLGLSVPNTIDFVAYESNNRLTNRGDKPWIAETGLPSIWLLGMFSPSPSTNIVIPFKAGDEAALGVKVNDIYFGKVPSNYLKVENDGLFFKGDGTRRGKIGINAARSKGIAGSYDAAGNVLTIVTYNVQAAPNGFVNSLWELQKNPFGGDVINSYNDGSPEAGKPPLGPFYELETSSPAAALKPNESINHIQQTLHFHGTEKDLDGIAKQMLGVGIEKIKTGI
jgi:hypothetical protein